MATRLFLRQQRRLNRAPKQAGRLLLPPGAQTPVPGAASVQDTGTSAARAVAPPVTVQAPPPTPAPAVQVVQLSGPIALDQSFVSQQKAFTVYPNAYALILGARANRRYLLVQNNGAGDMYLAFAVAPHTNDGTGAIKIAAGGYLELLFAIPTDQLFIMGTTAAGDTGTILEGTPAV